MNGVEQTEGFVIDWSRGAVAQPPLGLRRYEISFYSDFRQKEGSVIYSVSYAYDPSSRKGFIYLPGRNDASFRINTSTMWHGHGLEGNWFFATSEWESFVRPLIERAKPHVLWRKLRENVGVPDHDYAE